LAGGLLALGFAAYFLWRRRRRPKAPAPDAQEKPRVDARSEAATALYRTLELAMASQGIPRPPALPPLRYAEELSARQHPLGSAVLELTTTYIEARFGGVVIDDAGQREYERRVREIRAYKPVTGPA
jgi:hypothetical protein